MDASEASDKHPFCLVVVEIISGKIVMRIPQIGYQMERKCGVFQSATLGRPLNKVLARSIVCTGFHDMCILYLVCSCLACSNSVINILSL